MNLDYGIVQPWSEPGNFPRNLRQIIELYRFCLDQNADIVLAPMLCLSGQQVMDLALHSSFRIQHRHALEFLASEAHFIPLIIPELFWDNENRLSIHCLLLHQGYIHDLGIMQQDTYSQNKSILLHLPDNEYLIESDSQVIHKLLSSYQDNTNITGIVFSNDIWTLTQNHQTEDTAQVWKSLQLKRLINVSPCGISGCDIYPGHSSLSTEEHAPVQLAWMTQDAYCRSQYYTDTANQYSPIILGIQKRIEFLVRNAHCPILLIHTTKNLSSLALFSLLSFIQWDTPIYLECDPADNSSTKEWIQRMNEQWQLDLQFTYEGTDKIFHLIPASLTETIMHPTSRTYHSFDFYLNPFAELLDKECLQILKETSSPSEFDYEIEIHTDVIDCILEKMIDSHHSPTEFIQSPSMSDHELTIRKIQRQISNIQTHIKPLSLSMRKRYVTPLFHSFRD